MTANGGLSQSEFKSLASLVYDQTGINLSESKKPLLTSRLQKRLRKHGFSSYGDYYDYVISHHDEVEELINCITTNKTDFFRENVQFDYLKATLVPTWVAAHKRKIRIWSAAASTGEEAWTMAMTLYESLPNPGGWDVRILGTDIDTSVLARARAGIYNEERVEDLDRSRLLKHFVKTPEGYSIGDHLRKWVEFRQMNLTAPEWPLRQRFDAVFCRNVMIYFDHPTKDRLLRRFSKHVEEDGRLFVGLSEAVHWLPDVWRAVGPSIYEHAVSAADAPRRISVAASAPQTKAPAPKRSPKSLPAELAEHPSVRIIVGQVEACERPTIIRTLLGSCVAIGLFDANRGVGGLNHFLLPSARDVSEEKAASYGDRKSVV